MIFRFCRIKLSDHIYLFLVVLLIFKVSRNNLSGHVYIFHVFLLIFKVGPNNLSGHVYLFLVVLLIFKFSRNNLSDHVYWFLIVLLIFKVGRNNLSGHVYIFHVVMTCYTSTCQYKTTRRCKHYRNIRGVHRRFSIIILSVLKYKSNCCWTEAGRIFFGNVCNQQLIYLLVQICKHIVKKVTFGSEVR